MPFPSFARAEVSKGVKCPLNKPFPIEVGLTSKASILYLRNSNTAQNDNTYSKY